MIKNFVKHFLGSIRCHLNGIECSRGVYIGKNVRVVNGKNVTLGKNVSIRPDCDLFAGTKMFIGDYCDLGTRNRFTGNIIIENSVLIGPDNYIASVDHCYEDISKPVMNQGVYSPHNNGHQELRIGEGSWIGTHVSIVGDVHIGKHCVIAANAVVTRDVPDYCVVAGVPARMIKKYNIETKEWEKLK